MGKPAVLYQLIVYVPVSHLAQVKTALFEAGAGRYAHYDCCAFEVLGQGQFRPLAGSHPFLGQPNQVERVAEYRVEMICVQENIKKAITALKLAHPYEEPAYIVSKFENFV